MDTIEKFIELLEEEFDDLAPGTLKAATNYRDIEDWSSMYALIMIALVDTNYDVILSADDLKDTASVQDLYDVVKSKA